MILETVATVSQGIIHGTVTTLAQAVPVLELAGIGTICYATRGVLQ